MGEFQNRLRLLREACGYTQDELSKRLEVSRSTIGMYENGAREPDFETLEKIADFFNVDMNYLHGRSSASTTLPASVLTADERTMLEKYRRLDPYDRGRVDQLLKDALEKKSDVEADKEVRQDVG